MSIIPITPQTRISALSSVQTVIVNRNNTEISNDASDSKGTINTIDSNSLSFGPLAPGETSETKIVYLSVPFSLTIDNIKIALIDSGNIDFENNIFGVEIHNYIDYNLIPTSYFQGVNQDNSSDNLNNVVVGNKDRISSKYVYLNVNVPKEQKIDSGVIRFKWYFSYA